jgi:hypothetical protein
MKISSVGSWRSGTGFSGNGSGATPRRFKTTRANLAANHVEKTGTTWLSPRSEKGDNGFAIPPRAKFIRGREATKTKTPPPRREAAFCLIVTRKEELLCPWQAWQRPTLPGLKP